MIKHTRENPYKECGGFLYGTLEKSSKHIMCDIDAIYYEKKIGTNCEFVFDPIYILNAKNLLSQINSQEFLGTYHSHGQYKAMFSEIDRYQLQPFFGANKVTIIYSPAYSQLIGEFLDENGISHKAKILTK